MSIQHRSLVVEFPEHRETIHRLKQENAHFQRLMDEHEVIDKEIVRMEENIETPEDAVLTEEKKKRLKLKDDLLTMIHQANA
ncbi:MAG: YdcH family protein [Akkermansiaceae bacterium]